jgi:hypothetical protein
MEGKMRSVYRDLLKAGCEIDSHESDLYVRDTPAARTILQFHGKSWQAFRSQVDGLIWLDVPFAYEPFWEKRKT